MYTLGRMLGCAAVFFVAWCIVYAVLCHVGFARFEWQNFLLGCILAAVGAAAAISRLISWDPNFLAIPGREVPKRGLGAGFLAGVRIASVAVAVCTLLGLGLFFFARWYEKT